MIDVEPKELIFREVRLNQSYTSSLCLTNSQAISIDINLRPSSNRYHVSPNRIHLEAGQSIVVSVRLHVTHFPNYALGVKGQSDSIHLSSSFFEQKVDVRFYLTPKKSGYQAARSLSPSNSRSGLTRAADHSQSPNRDQPLPPLEDDRQIYEDKSKRALQILHQKDIQISQLQEEISQLRTSTASRSNDDSDQLRSKLVSLESENESLRRQLHQLGAAKESAEKNLSAVSSARDALEDKAVDQAEQIEVLISEISNLRRALDDEHQLSVLANEQSGLVSLQRRNDRLEQELRRANDRCRELQNEVDRLVQRSSEDHVAGRSPSELLPDSVHKEAVEPSDWKERLDMTAIGLLKERVLRAEAEVARMRSTQQDDDLHATHSSQSRSSFDNHHVKSGEEERKTVESDFGSFQDPGIEDSIEEKGGASRTVRGGGSKSASSDNADAHTWWSYVWHELKKNPNFGVHGEAIARMDGESEQSAGEEDGSAHLRAIVRSQAIELAALRQAQLLHSMQMRALKETHAATVEANEREIRKLQSRLKSHRNNGEIKILELSKTIQLLSQKSDMHRELSQVRDDFIAEKMCVHNLTVEIDSYRNILQVEQDKVNTTRRECSQLRSSLAAADVLKSICTIPGLDPSSLIELFSGRIMWLERALRKRETDVLLASSSFKNKSSRGGAVEFHQSPPNRDIDSQSHQQLHEGGDQDVFSDVHGDVLRRIQSPEKLLEVLDVVLLSKKLSEQDTHIKSLSSHILELEQKLVGKTNDDRSGDTTYTVEQALVSKLAIEKELNICQHSLSQAKFEVQRWKQKFTQNELELHDCKKDLAQLREGGVVCHICCGKFSLRGGRNDLEEKHDEESKIGTGCSGFDESCSRCADLAHTLRERTVQLKIVIESLEALQLGNGQSVDVLKAGRREGIEGTDADFLSDVAAFNVPATSSGSWEMQALVKRIVELTTELSSQHASNSMAERRVQCLEIDATHYQKELNHALLNLQKLESVVSTLQHNNIELVEKLNRMDKTLLEESALSENRIDELADELKQKEYKCEQLQIQLDHVGGQLEVLESESFRDWFKKTILLPDSIADHHITIESHKVGDGKVVPENRESVETVQDLVVSLLIQWREQVGYYPRGATGPVSKAEHTFLQRITELVLESHVRCQSAVHEANELRIVNRGLVLQLDVGKKRFENTMIFLNRYRCRAELCEKFLLDTELEKFKSNSEACKFFQRQATNLSDALKLKSKQLMDISLAKHAVDTELDSLRVDCKVLKSKVIALEDRTGSYSRARDEICCNLEGIVSNSERNMHKWVQIELPRLLSGLPITEDNFGAQDVDSTLDILGYGSATSSSYDKTIGAKRQDQVFALSHALCSMKASQSTMESKLNILKEKNLSMRERILDMEGTIERGLLSNDSHAIEPSRASHITSDTSDIDELSTLRTEHMQLNAKLLQAERRCESMESRERNITSMIEKFRQSENEIISHSSSQVSRISEALQANYTNQIKEITASYELEKIAMMEEISRLTNVLAGEDVDASQVGENLDQRVVDSRFHRRDSRRYDRVDSDDESTPRAVDNGSPSYSSSGEEADAHNTPEDIPPTIDPDDKKLESLPSKVSSGGNFTHHQDISRLERELHLESDRLMQAQHQIDELEQLLETQRKAFRRHLDMEREVLVTSSIAGSVSSTLLHSHDVASNDTTRNIIQQCDDDGTLLSQNTSESLKPSSSSKSCQTEDRTEESFVSGDKTGPMVDGHGDKSVWNGIESSEKLEDGFVKFLEYIKRELDSQEQPQSVLLVLTQCEVFIEKALTLIGISEVQPAGNSVALPEKDDSGSLVSNQTMLEDLQDRISELEDAFFDEANASTREWEIERLALRENIDRCKSEYESLREESARSMELMRIRYEKSLKNAQDTLDDQISASRTEIERLKGQVAFESNRHGNSEAPPDKEQVESLQKSVEDSVAEVDKYRGKLLDLEKQHGEELKNVWDHFERYRLSQEHIIKSLQSEVSFLESNSGRQPPRPQNISDDVAAQKRDFGDIDIEYRRLSELCRNKQEELNSILRAIVKMGAGTSVYGDSHISEQCAEPLDGRNHQCPHSLMSKLLQARVDTMECELSELQRALARERSSRNIEDQKPVMMSSSTQTSRDWNKTTTVEVVSAPDSSKTRDVKFLKDSIVELKEQVSLLKEENSRKSKLLTSIRGAKQAESNAVQMWKHEYEQCEDKLKRCNRSLISKEAVLKDSKAKIRSLESSLQEMSASDGDGGDVTSLGLSELRKRLKASELERGRARARLSSFRDKIFELEGQVATLSAKHDDAKELAEKLELAKVSNTRKEALVKSQKENIERLQVELLSFKEIATSRELDLEKHSRLLQRQLKESERRNKQLQAELEEKSTMHSLFESRSEKIGGRHGKTVVVGDNVVQERSHFRRSAEISVESDDDDSGEISSSSGQISATELSNIMSELNA